MYMWILYEILYAIGFLTYLPSALWRRRLPARGWTMRLGRYPANVTERLGQRRSIWVHAVSVGETLAAAPLVRALAQAYPQDNLVLSAVTPGGLSLASKQIPSQGAAVYVPLDVRGCVDRAVDRLRPRILLLMESELWPVMIDRLRAQRIPVAVVNGRVSPRTFARYKLARPLVRRLLQRVNLFLMQSQLDADRLIALGAPADAVKVVGSLKWDASLSMRPTPESLQEAATRIGLSSRDIIVVAGSTHRGEEAAVLAAFRQARRLSGQVRLIVAPRHLERLPEVEALARRAGWRTIRLSAPDTEWDVALVDTFGQLPQLYGLADVAFVGGSLVPHGGQNPLEPASLGKPVVFGPSMHNFSEISRQLLAYQAAQQLRSADEFTQVLQELLTDRRAAMAMGRRALELVERSRGVTRRALEALRPLLP